MTAEDHAYRGLAMLISQHGYHRSLNNVWHEAVNGCVSLGCSSSLTEVFSICLKSFVV